ncbi:oligosaccharide flippase family protein [Flavobacterium sp. MAHUQ-51]|uniref:oligosaccharide flippase family protein n=1 Tax=Flavobacterium sp. GCM10022190 TaxID=3252639 RepID=UPI00361D8A89
MKAIAYNLSAIPKRLSPEQLFMVTILFVNAGNYLYNLLLGRILGPEAFADAALLITFLLVLSFVGMTFQIVSAKYAVLLEENALHNFIQFITKYASILGVVIGILVCVFSAQLQALFHTESASMFYVFGVGIPLYFMMSVNRGLYQGHHKLQQLATTYQTEMLSRLLLTIGAVVLLPYFSTSLVVAAGITLSFVFGLFPFQKQIGKSIKPSVAKAATTIDQGAVVRFFMLTAFYELTQIIINNSDIILVKHYFDNEQAGLYASLALIGRVVYFVAWMFVMLLLPKVIQLKKEGKETVPVLLKYVAYISILSAGIVLASFLFPEIVVQLMFGDAYLSIAPLLWKYALATSVFAVANIFAYYFLSINQYFPVLVSGILGLTQITLIVFFHNSLTQVVEMQIIAMLALLFFQLAYFFYQSKMNIRRQ